MQPSTDWYSSLRRFWQTLHLPRMSSLGSWPRLWTICCGVLLMALLVGLVALHLRSNATTTSITALQGTNLSGMPAPTFALPDQNGKVTSLAQFTGHPVVLTFFDSVCPHQDCSLMASYLMATAQDLGAAQSKQIGWVALSLDPWHDTPATAQTFLATRHVTVPMHFVLGSLAQMAPLWSAYYMQSLLQPNGVVIHTTGVYLLDQHGRERVFMDEGFNPQTLSNDLHLLLTNPNVANARASNGVASGQGQAAGYVSLTKSSSSGTLILIVSPGQFGTFSFEVEAWEAQGLPAEGTATMELTMTSMNMRIGNVPLNESGDDAPGIYRAQGTPAMAGGWQAVVSIKPGDGSPAIQGTFHFSVKY